MHAFFWLCLGLIAYTYLIYPLAVILLARLLPGRPLPDADQLPTVTMLVSAYNEEAILEDKITNCLSLHYPPGRMRFLFGSDGSTDRTNAILEGIDDGNFQAILFPHRRGKSFVLNQLVKQAEGEVLLFSDANTIYQLEAVMKLMGHFSDPSVGGVCGSLQLLNPDKVTAGKGEGLYWSFENRIKEAEGRLKSVISANGAIFGVRRELLWPLPTRVPVNDDQLITLRILQRGRRVVYAPEALAVEHASPDMEGEFRRKIRISSLNFNGLPDLVKLLSPAYGFTALAVFSHKLLRWCVPFLALGLLASNIFLLPGGGIYPWLLLAQGLVYLGAGLGFAGDFLLGRSGPFLPFYYLAMINIAIVIGLWRSLTGAQRPDWDRVRHD